jgi:hypothetical protein
MLQVCELVNDVLHHVSTGVACPHHHAVSSQHLGQLGQEGTLVILLLSCGLVGH